jgi:hypothetical protein
VAAIEALVSLKGVGLWTAEAYLLLCEGRTDVFPGGDVALQEAIKWADGADVRPDTRGAYARAEVWRPWRGVACHADAHPYPGRSWCGVWVRGRGLACCGLCPVRGCRRVESDGWLEGAVV